MGSRWIVIAALALVSLGAIGLVAMVDRAPRAEPRASTAGSPPGSAHDLGAVQQQVAGLRSELVRLERQVARAAPAQEPARAEPPVASAPERKKAALDEQRRAVAWLDARVQTGPRDAAWSAQLRTELTASLEGGEGAGSSIGAIECGETICRGDVQLANRQTLERFVDRLGATLHRPFQLFFERDGDTLATTVFVPREGQPFPDLAKELATR